MRRSFIGLWLALAALALPLCFVSPAQGITPEPTPTEFPPPELTSPPEETPTPTEEPSLSPWPEVTPVGCVPGEMQIVSSDGMVIGGKMVKENGCEREHWEFIDLCPATIPNPNYTPPELRGYESEPDLYPQPEFLRPYCFLMAAFRLQYSEEIP